MTHLVVLPESDPERRVMDTRDVPTIAATLHGVGVRLEQWTASAELGPDATQDDVLAAYRADVDRIVREGGFASVDVLRLRPDGSPDWREKASAARKKFLEEHTHSEDEVRFFVEGSGTFYLHLDGKVHAVRCERGDLLSVPAGTRHWFDMGTAPAFAAIRIFGTTDGWVARFTGDALARRFPTHDALAAET